MLLAAFSLLSLGGALVFYDFWYRFGGRFDSASFLESYGQRVLLTYDDGPASSVACWSHSRSDIDAMREMILLSDPAWNFDQSTTQNLLRVLAEFNIHAVFFVRGDVLELDSEARSTLVAIRNAGHEIGNHCYGHARLEGISPRESIDEILRTDNLIRETSGLNPCLFRPPYGRWHIFRVLLGWMEPLLKHYCLPVGWTHSTADWDRTMEDISPSALDESVTKMINDLRSSASGSVLLQHDVWVYSVLFTRTLLRKIAEDNEISVLPPAEFVEHAMKITASSRASLLLGYYFKSRLLALRKRYVERHG